jgi:LysM repeat protein
LGVINTEYVLKNSLNNWEK